MKKHLFIIFSLLLVTYSVSGQESLTLPECIEIALENNLNLQNQSYNLERTAIDLKAAKQARYPNLNGNTGLGLNNGRTVDPTSNDFITTSFLSNNFSLSSNVTIYNFNRINNVIKQAKISKLSADEDYEQLKLDIMLQVTTAYVNTLFAQENVKNGQLQLEASQAQLEQMEAFIRAGSRPENDRLELQAGISNQEMNLINFKNQYDIAKLNLKQLLRLDYKQALNIKVLDNIDVNVAILGTTIDELVMNVVSNYPALKAAFHNTEVANMQVKIAKSSLYPSITARASLGSTYSNQGRRLVSSELESFSQPVEINGEPAILSTYSPNFLFEDNPYSNQINENLSYGFALNVSIPIYNNYRSKASIENAKLSLLQAKNAQEQIKDQLILSLQQVLADAKGAKKEMDAAEKTLKSINNVYTNAVKRSSLGNISTFELLQIQNQKETTQLQAIISKYNYIFKVKLLEYYMGIQ